MKNEKKRKEFEGRWLSIERNNNFGKEIWKTIKALQSNLRVVNFLGLTKMFTIERDSL